MNIFMMLYFSVIDKAMGLQCKFTDIEIIFFFSINVGAVILLLCLISFDSVDSYVIQ